MRYNKYRNDAWLADGGANDEGWHYRYCFRCNGRTEHGHTGCVTCLDRAIRARKKLKKN